jgi:glycosyltransferase involved in cell wall biosynthesis
MKIEVYCLAHQEAKIMPYFMKHYAQFAKVILLEGHSTDKTVDIALEWGAEIRKVDSNNEVNDEIWLQIKNNCWKDSKADWVIVCDADEFVYSRNLLKILSKTDSVVFLPRLFNMMSEVFPETRSQIYDEIQYGKEGGAKMNLFRPDCVGEINYAIGCHYADPVDKNGNKISPNVTSEILTLHMRHLSRAYTLEKNRYLYSRLSEVNKKHNWGYHLGASEEEYNRWFNNEMAQLIKVI